MINYIEVLGDCFPDAQAVIVGGADPTVYSNLVWITTPIPQSVLDASPCAIQGSPSQNEATDTLSVYHGKVIARSGTSFIPFNNTTPLITEGTQIWSHEVSLEDEQNKIKISSEVTVDSSRYNRIIIAMFRGNVCIGVSAATCYAANRPQPIGTLIIDQPNTTEPVIYSARIGKGHSSGSWYVGRLRSPMFNGQLANQQYMIEELGV